MSYAIEAKETLKAASNAVYSPACNRDVADYYLVDLVADGKRFTPLDSIGPCAPTASDWSFALAKLYPNYFGDISEFKLIEKHLDAFA